MLNKSLIAWLYSDLSTDKALYLLFTKSFLKTGIMADEIRMAETGAAVYLYDPAVYSPLYSLLSAPLLWVTKSYFITQLSVSVAGWALFFTALYKTAFLVLEKKWWTNLFVAGTGFYLYPHELFSTPKDTLAAAFSLWCMVLIVQFTGGKPRWQTTLLLALSLACMGLTKLLYAPLVVVLLGLLLLFLFLAKSRRHFVPYFVCVAIVLLVVFGTWLLLWLPAKELAITNPLGIPGDGTRFEGGFYLHNLLHTYPFVSSAVINTDFWGVQIQRWSAMSFGQAMHVFRALDVVVLLLLVLALATNAGKVRFANIAVLLVAGASTLAGMVVYLSVSTMAFSYSSAPGVYTYVSEGRSFLLAMIALQLFLFYFACQIRRAKGLRAVLLLLFLLECFHGLYFTVKQTWNAPEIRAYKTNDDAVKQVTNLLQNTAEGKLPLITTDRHLRRYAALHGINVYSFTNAPMNTSWMKQKGRFIVATHVADSAYLKKLPARQLTPMDAIPPYRLHRFDVP